MKTRLFVFAALALALAACNKDNNEVLDNDGPVAAEFTAAIGNNMTTRVSGTDGDQWDNGDCIGITGAGYTNIPYVINNNRFAPQSTVIYFNGPETKTFNAYYPYNAAGGTLAVSTTADNQGSGIDFLFASGATGSTRNPTVSFTGEYSFRHCMSRITLTFEAGDGVDFSMVKPNAYTLGGVKLDGTFDTATGTAAADDGAQAGEVSMELENGNLTSSVIIFPQATASLPLVVNYNSQTYTATLTVPEGALKAGKRYTYTVRVNATGLTLEGCTISDWTDESKETDGVAENFGYTYDGASNTYFVYNAEGLLAWEKVTRKNPSANCTLTADITLSAVVNGESNWTPINSYTGIFDGGGHAITGLTVYQPNTDYVGMFGTVNKNGAVQNLTLMDVKITGGINVGGVAGYNNEGTVTGCSTSGNVSGNTNVGSVVGQNNSGNISGCNTAANVSGNYYAGGVAGYNNEGNISGCSAAGNVSGDYYIGGVAGWNNSGNVTACYHATSTVTGTGSSAGGVVGTNENGTVTGTVAGGVAGGNEGILTACYWSNSLDAGVGSGSGETTKVDGTTVTWVDAQRGMNEAIDKWNGSNTDNPCNWHYAGATATTPPTLAASSNP